MNWRYMIGLSALTALGFALLPSSAISQQKSLKEQLIGTWTLVSATQRTKEGVKSDRWGPNPRGRAIFEANGSYSFMIFRSDVPKFASNNMNQVTAEESKAAIQGMTANYGTWSIDEATKTLTTNIEASSSPISISDDSFQHLLTIFIGINLIRIFNWFNLYGIIGHNSTEIN